MRSLGFRVKDLGVKGLGFRIEGRLYSLGFGVPLFLGLN